MVFRGRPKLSSLIHPLTKLSRKEFTQFRREFDQFPCPGEPDRRKLVDVMPGSDLKLKLRAARLRQHGGYMQATGCRRRVSSKGRGGAPTSRCLKAIQPAAFGARFPLYFDNLPVPDDLWHLRLHMYIGSQFRPRLQGETCILLDQVQDTTVDIYDYVDDADWISESTAKHFYGLTGIYNPNVHLTCMLFMSVA